MTDVNLSNPDLRLVSSRDSVPARATTSPLAVGSGVSTQNATATGVAQDASVNQVVAAQQPPEARKEQLDSAVSRLNDFVQTVQRDLQFEVDNDSGHTIVRVVDQETQEIIRQMPDDVALRLAENLQQDEPLTLFNLKV